MMNNFNLKLSKVNTVYIKQVQVMNIDNLKLHVRKVFMIILISMKS